ncbi:LuxR family transcriptional regulator [Microbispora triticiradicis]|uniref:LuxR family transcriptional regulator n=2 Tax=Microbispora TaxID=2005 RepID=A0ABY3M319_9ACTN|nr:MULTISPECIES: LuxR family transcriptional regulator [Microbispora]TLP54015.1 LuxR family transcriptional regulator [Microbispora fusca]TYB65130.1 LuxR family transcriptional regulator [Microbispora tritici]
MYEERISETASATVVRTAELDLLRALTQEPGSEGRLVAVLGEPGSGKTHLLSALVRERQWTALPATVHRCSSGDRERAIDAVRKALWRARRAGEREEPARPVIGLARRRSRPDRELVVIEDAHLADDETIGELAAIAGGDPVPLADVVVSLRPRQTPDLLAEAIAATTAFGRTARIELAPLDDERMLAMSPVPAPYELRHRSGGNPFNLRALQALERSARSGGDGALAPFEFAVMSEVRDLTLTERYALHAAAILRSRFDADLLAEVAALDPLVASAALRRLVRRDLVRVEPVGTLFSIRDEVFGSLLRQMIDPCWAALAHQRALHRLSARGQAGTQIGFHLVSSLSRARAGELTQIVDASQEIMETDVSECVSWLTPVLAEAPPSTEIGARARLALSTAFGRLGRMPESRDLLFLVHESDAPVDPAVFAEHVAFVSVVEGVLSQDVQMLDLLGHLLDRPGLRDSPVWPRLVLARSFRVSMLGRAVDSAEADSALRAARAAGDDLVAAGLLGLRALASVAAGDVERALADADAAAESLDRTPEHLVARHVECLLLAGLAYIYLGRNADAQRQVRRGVDVARRRQRPFLLPTLLVMLSEAERHLGRLRQARDAADAAIVESGPGNPLRHAQAVALKSAAEVWMQPVASGRAKSLAQQALARQALTGTHVNGSASIAALTLAKCAWLDGDPTHCVTLLLNEGRGPDLRVIPSGTRPTMWETLCAAGLDAGMPLDEWARRAQEHARAVPMPHNLAYAAMTGGHLLRTRAAPGEAARRYREAAELFATAGMPIEQSYALGQAARALAEQGRADQAAHTVRLAAEIARRSEAVTLLHWLDRQTGGRPASRPAPQPSSRQEMFGRLEVFGRLTHREREIALLICSGMKRRDIADRLTISTRTVDVHLTRIYRKTGVSSRMELALAIQRKAAGQEYAIGF